MLKFFIPYKNGIVFQKIFSHWILHQAIAVLNTNKVSHIYVRSWVSATYEVLSIFIYIVKNKVGNDDNEDMQH